WIAGTMVSIGLISGPTVGGLLLGSFSWHWIFFVNLPIGLIGILLAIRFVPRSAAENRERFDLPGALSLFITLLAFLLGLTFGQDRGFTSLPVLGLLGLSLASLLVFYWVETHTDSPIIDLSLFQNRLFSVN